MWEKWCKLYTKVDMKENIRILVGERRLNNLAALRSVMQAGGRNLSRDAPPMPPWKI